MEIGKPICARLRGSRTQKQVFVYSPPAPWLRYPATCVRGGFMIHIMYVFILVFDFPAAVCGLFCAVSAKI